MKKLIIFLFVIFLLSGGFFLNEGVAQTQKPKIAPICKQCHQPDEKVLRGVLGNVAKGIIQVNVGPAIWVNLIAIQGLSVQSPSGRYQKKKR